MAAKLQTRPWTVVSPKVAKLQTHRWEWFYSAKCGLIMQSRAFPTRHPIQKVERTNNECPEQSPKKAKVSWTLGNTGSKEASSPGNSRGNESCRLRRCNKIDSRADRTSMIANSVAGIKASWTSEGLHENTEELWPSCQQKAFDQLLGVPLPLLARSQ